MGHCKGVEEDGTGGAEVLAGCDEVTIVLKFFLIRCRTIHMYQLYVICSIFHIVGS